MNKGLCGNTSGRVGLTNSSDALETRKREVSNKRFNTSIKRNVTHYVYRFWLVKHICTYVESRYWGIFSATLLFDVNMDENLSKKGAKEGKILCRKTTEHTLTSVHICDQGMCSCKYNNRSSVEQPPPTCLSDVYTAHMFSGTGMHTQSHTEMRGGAFLTSWPRPAGAFWSVAWANWALGVDCLCNGPDLQRNKSPL